MTLGIPDEELPMQQREAEEAAKPVRIQRKRTKLWRMPPNTVSVCRPGKWGNPFKKGVAPAHTTGQAVAYFRVNLLRGTLGYTVDDVRRELRGKNLACYCPLDQPCHADVLLEEANR